MANTKNQKPSTEDAMATVSALIAKAKREGSIQSSELTAELEKLDLPVEKIEHIYDTFDAMGIQIVSPELELDVSDDLGMDMDEVPDNDEEELVDPLPQPRHIVAVSPGEVPWNDAEKARMKALNKRDVSIDYAFMVTVEKIMRHGCENVPDYMLSGSRGDFTGVGDIHFFYSADEVLYGALPDFEEACKRANVPYTVSARPKMVHCYCMLPIFKEAKEDFAKIVDILKK